MGPKKVNLDEIRLPMNHEPDELLKYENIARTIKALGIRWYGHVLRSEKGTPWKKLTEWTPVEIRPGGRSKLKWKKQVKNYLRRMKVEKCGLIHYTHRICGVLQEQLQFLRKSTA